MPKNPIVRSNVKDTFFDILREITEIKQLLVQLSGQIKDLQIQQGTSNGIETNAAPEGKNQDKKI